MTAGAAPPQVYSGEEQFGGFVRAEPEDLSRFSKDPLEDVREYRRSTGDVPEYYGKDDAASRRALFEAVRGGMSEGLSASEVTDAREHATTSGVSPEQFDMTLRRELFEQVKQLAADKNLSPTEFGTYRESATALGITPEQFDTTFSKAGITGAVGEGLTTNPKAFDEAVAEVPDDEALAREGEAFLAKQDKEIAAPVEDQAARQAAAAQKVMGARGIEKQKAMQSDDYVLGSGSALRQTPRELGTLSGAMNRAGRRLQRKGAWGEAQKMFGGAEDQRRNEGSRIRTPERIAQEEAERKRERDLMAQEQEVLQRTKDYLNRSGQERPTMGKRVNPAATGFRGTPIKKD
tara:strand:- start:4459 stop:5502 length:1044 start_codon:yes stop_codon:yes gene_type:complete